ncbi:MAG: hypothetical protein ACI9W4_000400 [Rhodothermales bacterium]
MDLWAKIFGLYAVFPPLLRWALEPALCRGIPTGNTQFLMGKLHIMREFWSFLRVRKKYWLAPIAVVLVLLSVIIVAAQGSALAPFIYALF